MDRHVTYATEGVCASRIDFDLVDGYVHNVVFTGGCRGNGSGVASMCEGVKAEEVIRRLKDIRCRDDGNSCPHQLALAVEANMEEE